MIVLSEAVLHLFRYYFPTYENDNLLCGLEDDNEEDEEEATKVEVDSNRGVRRRTTSTEVDLVIAEDIPVKDSILKDSDLLEDLKS